MFKTLGKAGNSAYLQYNNNEWRYGNQVLFDLADGDCSKCEALVSDNWRLRKEVEERENKKDKEVERQFDLRLHDLKFWRAELEKQVAALQRCNDLLPRMKSRLQEFGEGCNSALKTCREVIVRRDARKGLDLVHGDMNKALQKYLALHYDIVAVVDRTVSEIENQERSNTAMSRHIMRDIEDKFTAATIDIDSQATCRAIGKPQSLKFDEILLRPAPTAVTLADWESWTKHNIEKVDQEISATDKLRALMEQILRQSYEDLDLQRRRVLQAEKDRIKELGEAQNQLEIRLGPVSDLISAQKSDLNRLLLTKDDTLNRLTLAQTRIRDRRFRPRMELVRDSVENELEKEVAQLCDGVKSVDQKIKEVREMLKKLEQTQLGLEKEIEQKRDSIFIEQTCLKAFTQVSHCHY